MTAIGNDAATNYEDEYADATDEGGAAEEFLKRFTPPDADKKPSGSEADDKDETATKPPKTPKDPAEKPEDKGDEEKDEEETEEKTDEEKEGGEEEPIFKITVDGKEHEVPASKLTRLYGQEQALTRKSMEASEARKKADADIERTTAAAAALLERARARAKPFAGIDFNLAAAKLTEEEYTALKAQATIANEEVQFLEQQTGSFLQAIKEKQQAELVAEATNTIKLLSGPVEEGGIEGWSDKMYNELRDYAKSKGCPADVMNSIVQPWAIHMMHSAMMFERGKSKANVKITKVNKAPTKVVKTTNSPAARGGDKTANADKAMKSLKRSGSTDDAADAFLARWGAASDDD